jgi:hypothetical protein
VWIFFDFFNSKASTHVAARDAFKRRNTSRLPLHRRHIITKVYINMVFINKKPGQHAAPATSSTRMDTRALTVLLQGDTTSTMTSTTSNVEQMHRHTGITIVMTS